MAIFSLHLAELQTGDGVCTDKALLTDRLTGSSTLTVPPPPIISKPDAEFLALGLEFVETREGIKITELNELFEKVSSSSSSSASRVENDSSSSSSSESSQ
jgi:hypothetical protein